MKIYLNPDDYHQRLLNKKIGLARKSETLVIIFLSHFRVLSFFTNHRKREYSGFTPKLREGELIRNTVVSIFATTAADGNRVKSLRGTQFRIWAGHLLKEYMKKESQNRE